MRIHVDPDPKHWLKTRYDWTLHVQGKEYYLQPFEKAPWIQTGQLLKQALAEESTCKERGTAYTVKVGIVKNNFVRQMALLEPH